MTRPIPEGYTSLTPHVTVSPASAAIEFYAKAFGAEELARMPGPDGQILHAELRIGNARLMLHDPSPMLDTVVAPSDAGHTTCVLHVYTEDVDALYRRATEAGATGTMPPSDMFWGDRYAMVADPFGHVWGLATHTEDVTPEQIAERMAAMR